MMSKHTDADLRIDSLPPSENNDGDNAILTTEGVLKKFFLFHIKNSAHKQAFEQSFSSVCSDREANKRVSKTTPPKKPDDNHDVTTTKPMPESKPTSSKRCFYEDNKEQEEGKNKKNNRRVRVQADPIAPKLPTEFEQKVKGELKGSDVKLVIEKELSKTDMEKHQNRLLIPRAQANVEFLTEKEKASLNEKEGNHYIGMKVPMIYWKTKELEVPLMEPRLDSSTIWLKNWKSGNKNALVLASSWTRIASENGLEIGNIIQLWSFRVKQELHMALVKL